MSSNCSKHKKDVAGVSDMKVLAEMIGDLHYESLLQFLRDLSIKLELDGFKDQQAGRTNLGNHLMYASENITVAADFMDAAWQISKPFMQE